MHRIRYTKLTPDQIQQKIAATAAGPGSRSDLSEILAGKSLTIVADKGPVLRYHFESRNGLVLTEDNGAPVRAGYGALTLKQLVFFSHMVPGTQRGYHVVVDQRTNLVTVFEVWFSGYVDNREVQRQIYYGYVETAGQAAPKARHHMTNRLQGKGLYWKQDNGIETLEFFPSVLSSSFVELTRFGGELTFCAPSDFIRIDDEIYVYARVECEFSGTMTLYVLDLFTLAQAGVRLGFDETDALEYYLFRGKGEITGQLATFQPFGDNGETIAMGNMPEPSKKGERLAYRPLKLHPPMSEEEVRRAAQKKTVLFDPTNMMAGNRGPLSDFLIGKRLTARYDNGAAWEYRFDEIKKLHWRRAGESAWHEEVYEAYEAAEELILFSHLLSGTQPAQCTAIALDFANALTTCVESKMGTRYSGNEVTQNIIFGVIEMDGLTAPQYNRHKFTDELVGHAVTWNYSGSLTSWHVYSSPRSSSWTIFLPNGTAGLQWSSPCNYVKLRDDCYLFTWIEEACNGSQGLIVYNTRTLHDCGFSFDADHDGLKLNTIGAYARNAGFYDVRKYYGPKQAWTRGERSEEPGGFRQ
jgi:hypothetical protein